MVYAHSHKDITNEIICSQKEKKKQKKKRKSYVYAVANRGDDIFETNRKK